MKKLYDLIQSLSQAEKRHIKLRLTNNKENSLLTDYYDILSKQKNYNLELLLQECGKSQKLTQSNTSLLYEIILKDLSYIIEEENVEINLRSYISDIKVLVAKGFLEQAESRCIKLIVKAEDFEELTIQKEANIELWEINFKRGTVKIDEIQKIQNKIEEIESKIDTLNKIQNYYRIIAAHYYNYFFYNAAERLTEPIISIFSEVDKIIVNSSKAKLAYLEIKAMEYLLKSNALQHHEIRKEQLLLSLSGNAPEINKISQLLILSNIFTKLKIDRNINELDAYMQLLETSFFDFSEKQKNHVFMEKYYDIYFLNHIYTQIFRSKFNVSENLFKLFDFVVKQKHITNEILVSRIHLALIELRLIEEDYTGALKQLEIYCDHFKKNKKTNQFLEAQILEAITIYLLKNFDIFLNKMEQINRQVKVQKHSPNSDLQVMLQFLDSISCSRSVNKEDIVNNIKYRQTFKLLIYKIVDKLPMAEIIKNKFPINDENYHSENDTYLQNIKKLMYTNL